MNDIGEEEYAAFKKWDIGDIVEVCGFVFKTRTGRYQFTLKQSGFFPNHFFRFLKSSTVLLIPIQDTENVILI